jgi:hypothetical protein
MVSDALVMIALALFGGLVGLMIGAVCSVVFLIARDILEDAPFVAKALAVALFVVGAAASLWLYFERVPR